MNKKILSIGFSVILLIVTIYSLIPKDDKVVAELIVGQTMGSIVYNIKVVGVESNGFKKAIDSLLAEFNKSLSVYIPDSEISLFNKNGELEHPSNLFLDVFKKSKQVYEQTDGTFDPTVGPLIQVWGFGPNKTVITPDSSAIDSILLLISMEKVDLINGRMTKDSNVQLDFGAIAKGQAVDEVTKWLEAHGAMNYMVEIGGEVSCKGQNEKGEVWAIGIEDPMVDQLDRRLLAIAKLKDRSLATSGNYRNFYEKDGQIFAHIIDPRTGYTANHNLLSASVFARDCMTADAFATAFMVLGLEESIRIVEEDPDLEAIFVFKSEEEMDIYVSTGITNSIELIEKE